MKMHVLNVERSGESANDGEHYEGHSWTLCGLYLYIDWHAERPEAVTCKRCSAGARIGPVRPMKLAEEGS